MGNLIGTVKFLHCASKFIGVSPYVYSPSKCQVLRLHLLYDITHRTLIVLYIFGTGKIKDNVDKEQPSPNVN